ncbi:MAG: hypothetical protein DME56_08310 [Verrucomicrobia bacterium]|nr:MAG: hypothetical protein DME56_08310 [Verrucomicrobiota bacterium]
MPKATVREVFFKTLQRLPDRPLTHCLLRLEFIANALVIPSEVEESLIIVWRRRFAFAWNCAKNNLDSFYARGCFSSNDSARDQ